MCLRISEHFRLEFDRISQILALESCVIVFGISAVDNSYC